MSKKNLTTSVSSTLLLTEERTGFVGTLKGSVELYSPASILLVGVESNIAILDQKEDRSIETSIALIPPEVKVSVDSQGGRLVVVFLDVLKLDYLSLSDGRELLDFGFPSSLSLLHDIREQLNASDSERATAEEITRVFSLLDELRKDDLEPDTRVQKVSQLIKEDIASNLGVEELAQSVSLSVPQLHHVFKKQTGITLRKYRAWRRIYISMSQYGEGFSLTDAAQHAGFADASHFIRAFKDVYGTSPKKLLANAEALDIICA